MKKILSLALMSAFAFAVVAADKPAECKKAAECPKAVECKEATKCPKADAQTCPAKKACERKPEAAK